MKLVIFGIGQYFLNRKEQLFQVCEDAEIVCYIDNKADESTIFEGKKVLKPCQLINVVYDKILLMSKSYLEMRAQLITLGYLKESIWTWDQFLCEMSHGKFQFFCGEYNDKKDKSLLIISTDLGYNGGSIAAVYAAMELSNRYKVVLAAPRGDMKFVREMAANGISILICPAIPYLGKEEIYVIKKFDMIIVNVFQMLPVVCQVSKLRPALWWIHEPSDMYRDTLDHFSPFLDQNSFRKVNIRAVSNVPKENFNSYFPNRIQKTLAYGIPDQCTINTSSKAKQSFVFAIIGGLVPRKAQDVFIKAIDLIHREMQTTMNIEYWIIGGISEIGYGAQIQEMSKINAQIKIKGKLTRDEIAKAYQEIDVVVCPSYEDPLPIVMTEGMMYGKVCIASDVTGTAVFIKDGVNGLICKAGDAENLAFKMQWVIEHPDKLDDIRGNARKTYEENFTMEKFGQRLEEAIHETIEIYGE